MYRHGIIFTFFASSFTFGVVKDKIETLVGSRVNCRDGGNNSLERVLNTILIESRFGYYY
jgi:hypothetical protein